MSIAEIEKYDPTYGFYNLKDKLWEHIKTRSEEAFKETEKKRSAVNTISELKKYADEKREQFIESIGGIPYDKSLPLNAKITGEIDEEELKIEKIIFQSRPGVYVTANLYLPKKEEGPFGVVLFQNGHNKEGKASVGSQRVARIICSAGLAVFDFDPVGQGERFSYFEEQIGRLMVGPITMEHEYSGEQCILTGKTITRYFIADAMRAVDYLETRSDIDKDRIGATGSSGGGTATCHMMLCDPRIKAAAPGTFVTTKKAYLYSGGAQDAEQLWLDGGKNLIDHHEMLISFAPKPLLLLTVDSDFFPIEGSIDVYNKCKHFWELSGKSDAFKMFTDASLHAYTENLAIAAAEFFSKFLNGKDIKIERKSYNILSEKALACTQKGQVKLEFTDSKSVYDENKEIFLGFEKNKEGFKEFLLGKMNYQRNPEKFHLRTFTPIYECGMKISPYLWFVQEKMPNFALSFSDYTKEPKDTVICLWDKGTSDIENHIYLIKEITDSGKNAMVLDLSGMGKCFPNTLDMCRTDKDFFGVLDRLTKDLMYLGDSLCAIRLFELDYAIKNLKKKTDGEISVYAEGVSAMYARLIKVVNEEIEVMIERPMPDYGEIVKSKYYISYNIAGVLLPGVAEFFNI